MKNSTANYCEVYQKTFNKKKILKKKTLMNLDFMKTGSKIQWILINSLCSRKVRR